MLEYLHWTPNANLLVSVLKNRVSIYWKSLISWNILLEKIKKLRPLAQLARGLDPKLSMGVKT